MHSSGRRTPGIEPIYPSVIDAPWREVMATLRAYGIRGKQDAWEALDSRKLYVDERDLLAAHELTPTLKGLMKDDLQLVTFESDSVVSGLRASAGYLRAKDGTHKADFNQFWAPRPRSVKDTDSRLVFGIIPPVFGNHPTYVRTLNQERRQLVTRGAWYDLREYFAERGWEWGEWMLSARNVRRVEVCEAIVSAIADTTNLTLQAIAAKHGVEFDVLRSNLPTGSNYVYIRPMHEGEGEEEYG